jgi:hypothetical protein
MKEHKNKIKLDALLDKNEPFASFHDARLRKIQIDYLKREITAELELSVGNPDGDTNEERERCRNGLLKISGLIYWAIEPPESNVTIGPLWLASDGLIEEANTETAKKLRTILQPDFFAWYLYFSDINAYAYLVAKEAEFKWGNA